MNETEHIDSGVLPNALVEREQWLCWEQQDRDGKPTKVPITPGSSAFVSATDPETWTDFETAVDHRQSTEVDGLGFVSTEQDPLVGVDLNDCRDPETGDVDDDARDIVTRLDFYTEISPSGTGFHILLEGELPEGRNRKGIVEMYDAARFFTMTGDHVDVTPRTVEERYGSSCAGSRARARSTPSTGSSSTSRRTPCTLRRGPHESGRTLTGPVSGAELAGATVTVEFADGSTSEPWNVVVLQNDPSQVDPGLDPIGDFENAPADPDGDGKYEDVNGNGAVNVGDAQAIFANGLQAGDSGSEESEAS